MSIQGIEAFFKQIADDEGLQEQMKKLAEDKQGEELLKAICELGAAQDYVFSAEELARVAKSSEQSGGELDDAALEQVSAGSFWTNILRDINNVNSWIGNTLGTNWRPDDDRKSTNRNLGYDDP